ncbi:MAG: peptidyl-prolyl cis-trans isomerase [Lentisphaeria bacterium]
MSPHHFIFTFWVAAGLLAAIPSLRAAPALQDGVAAVIGDEIITVSDIAGETRPFEETLHNKYRNQPDELMRQIEQLRRNVAQRLVDRELIWCEFKAKDYKLPPEPVQKRIDEIIQNQAGGNRERFEKMLARDGMSFREFEDKARKMVAIDMLVEEAVRRPVHISPADIKTYYDAHPDQFRQPGRIRLAMIILKKDGRHAADFEETVTAIQRALAAGGDFAALAGQYSEGPNPAGGGDAGWLPEQDVDAAVASLQPGQASAPLRKTEGVVFLKLLDRQAAGPAPLDFALARRIERTLRSQDETRRYDLYLGELRKRYRVKTFF